MKKSQPMVPLTGDQKNQPLLEDIATGEKLERIRIDIEGKNDAQLNVDPKDPSIILEDKETDKMLDRADGKSDDQNSDSTSVWHDTKDLLLFGGYNSGAAVIGATTNFIAVKFIADWDPNLLSASGLISALQNFIYYFSSGCLCSTAILTSAKMQPNGEKSEIGAIARQSWVLSGLISIPATLLTVFSGDLFKLLKQDPETADSTQEYFRASAYSLPAYFAMVCNTQIAMGLQKPQVIFWTFLAQRALYIGLAYPLMFGISGSIPSLGIKGLGYANTISVWSSFIGSTAYIVWLSKKNPHYEIFNFNSAKGGLKGLKELAKLGLPISFKIGIDLAATQMLALMAGWLDKDMLTSFEIALQYMFLLTLPATNLGQASGVLISNTLAKGNIAKARRLANVCSVVSAVVPTVAIVLFFATPRPLIRFFVDEEDPRSLAIVSTTTHLLWLTAGGVFDSMRSAYEGSLRGFNDTKFAMFSGLINNLFAAVPLALLAYFDNTGAGSEEKGMCGIFAARMGCMVACAASLCLRWFYRSSTYQSDTTTSHMNRSSPEPSQAESRPKPQSCWSWITSFFCRTNQQTENSPKPVQRPLLSMKIEEENSHVPQ